MSPIPSALGWSPRGVGATIRLALVFGATALGGSFFDSSLLAAEARPTPEMLQVLDDAPPPGPRITPFLRQQLDRAWRQDEARVKAFAAVRSEADLEGLKRTLRARLLETIGGLPETRSPLRAQIGETIPRDGYRIEKLVFESLPGLHVTALVYVPDAPSGPKPAVLVACGHSPLGKAYKAYQEIAARLAKRGYVVLVFDPIGQGERSQFWDAARGRSRYNLVCGEHAVLGNLCTLAGTSVIRYMVWDGMRALDYLQTRPDVDAARIAITGTSGGGFQSTWIGALDERIRIILPSCFPTALPMRMANRIFEDPDSDPEQDPFGLVSGGIDHAGLLLLAHPRPLHVAAAVKDFFPIEGTRKTIREVRTLYERFDLGDRIALSEGFHNHQYSAENQASAFAFLDRAFGRPARGGLDPVTTLDPEALLCTRSGQVRVDLPGRSLPEIVREDFEERRKHTGPDLAALYGGEGYPGIRGWSVGRYEGQATPPQIAVEAKGTSSVGNAIIERHLVHHAGGLSLPVLYVRPRSGRPARTLLRVGLEGKIGAKDWSVVEADLARGDAVLSFDPRGLGETRMRYLAASIDDPNLAPADEDAAYVSPLSGVLANHVYNALLIGRPYFFEMLEDAEIAVRFAREALGSQRLAVAGEGDAHLYAKAIAAVVPGVDLVPPKGGETSFSWAAAVEGMQEVWPIHYLVPGGAHLQVANEGRAGSPAQRGTAARTTRPSPSRR